MVDPFTADDAVVWKDLEAATVERRDGMWPLKIQIGYYLDLDVNWKVQVE